MIAVGTFAGSDIAIVAVGVDELATLPASNLFKPRPDDRWRTPASSGQVTLDFGAALPVRAIWLGYTNATVAATWRIRASASIVTITSAPAFDSGSVLMRPDNASSVWTRTHSLLWLTGETSYRYWRIDVNQVSGASFFEAGRVGFFGNTNLWIPSRGRDFGDAVQPIDASVRRRARSGAAHAVVGGRWRVGTFRLSGLTLFELRRTMGDLERRVSGTTPFLYLLDPEAKQIGLPTVGTGILLKTDPDLMDGCLYSYFSEPPYPINEGPDFYRASWTVEEVEHP